MKKLQAFSLMTLLAAALLGWLMGPAGEKRLEDINLYVFVPSRATPEVAVIDTRSDRVVTVLKLGHTPDQVLVSEAAHRLIASHVGNKSISIVNPDTGETEKVIMLAIRPERMVLSPEGWLVAARDMTAGSVSVLSLQRQSQLAQVDGFKEPYGLTFSNDSLYIADRGTGKVSTIALAQGKVIGEIAVADPAQAATKGDQANRSYGISELTHTPNGRLGFCALRGGRDLAVIDLTEERKTKTLAVGRDPSRPWGTADGRLMMVANNRDRTISVIDTGALEVVATLPGAADITAINTGWFESVAFIISRSENKAVVLDLMKLKKVGEIPLLSGPGPGVVTPDGKKLYVALRGSNRVAVIDTRERKLTSMISGVGHEPSDATMARSNNYCH
ncbi:MAG: YncE family protein [Deltaproteobacteria bacterium]|nr:YncE family protein [Deltaproteobacteria bacterium]